MCPTGVSAYLDSLYEIPPMGVSASPLMSGIVTVLRRLCKTVIATSSTAAKKMNNT